MSGTYELRLRGSPLFGAFIGGGFGLFNLVVGLNRPSIANIRTIDLVHLLATGACFGVALAAVVVYFRCRRQD